MSNKLDTEKLEDITNDVTSLFTTNIPPKRGRGRPAKYTKEERDQKYKEARDQWAKQHTNLKNKANIDYMERSRFAYRLLCDMWTNHKFDCVDTDYKIIIQELVENKKILSI